ncbi:MAG: SET domain-containing protein-lysine N-methyltransferase [Sphingobacteriales bacterium]|nr:SET domain-containing protein-lysine N-methyltransferase [Sphingobacteriales bacterium]
MDILINPHFRTISNHGVGEVRRKLSNGQNHFFATRSFKPGDVIATFSAGTISAEPTYLTVQIGIRKHITLDPEFLQYINHGCDPNVFFNTTTMEVTALKHISVNEEMTFFYPSTEWKMAQSFACYCGSHRCLEKIRGAAYLSPEVQSQYRFTDFIQQQLAKRAARRKVA